MTRVTTTPMETILIKLFFIRVNKNFIKTVWGEVNLSDPNPKKNIKNIST